MTRVQTANENTKSKNKLLFCLLFSPFFILCMCLVSLGLVLASVHQKTKLVQLMQDQSMLNQVNYEFKVQVQEWKNFLIRSCIEGQHEYYWARFEEQEQVVRELADDFRNQIDNAQLMKTLAQFADQHQMMGDAYRKAKRAFLTSDLDLQIADKLVAGIDREPANTMKESIDRANFLVNRESYKAERISSTTTGVSIALLLTIGFWLGTMTILGTVRIMDKEDRRKRKILEIASTDPVTRVNNRFALEQRYEQLFVERRHDDQLIQLVYLDLDEFKPLNDQYGHDVGDAFLRLFAEKLSQSVSREDFVARIGGDEFVVLRPRPAKSDIGGNYIRDLEEKICVDYQLGNVVVRAEVSIGESLFPNDGRILRSLIRRADERMYSAKQAKQKLNRPQTESPKHPIFPL